MTSITVTPPINDFERWETEKDKKIKELEETLMELSKMVDELEKVIKAMLMKQNGE